MDKLEHYETYLTTRNYSSQTILHYLNDLSLFHRSALKDWQKINKKDVSQFIEIQLKKHCKPKTINRRLYAIRGFYLYLKEEMNLSIDSPVKRSQFIRVGRPLPQTLKDHEIEQFFSVVEDLRDQTIFHLMLRCGLRVSEVTQLRLEDVDLFGKKIRFFGKGNKERAIPLSDKTHDLLKQCLKIRPQSAPAFFWNKKKPFDSIKINSIQRLLKRYAKKAQLNIHCHLLRHTFARQMTESGMDRTVLRDLMGHASVSSTDVYGKLSSPFVKESYFEAMKKIETHALK